MLKTQCRAQRSKGYLFAAIIISASWCGANPTSTKPQFCKSPDDVIILPDAKGREFFLYGCDKFNQARQLSRGELVSMYNSSKNLTPQENTLKVWYSAFGLTGAEASQSSLMKSFKSLPDTDNYQPSTPNLASAQALASYFLASKKLGNPSSDGKIQVTVSTKTSSLNEEVLSSTLSRCMATISASESKTSSADCICGKVKMLNTIDYTCSKEQQIVPTGSTSPSGGPLNGKAR